MTGTGMDHAGGAGVDTIELEFAVEAEDNVGAGLTLMRSYRRIRVITAFVAGGLAVVFALWGSPVTTVLMALLAAYFIFLPRLPLIDPFFARRMTGNRVGIEWKYQISESGIAYDGGGLSGVIDWIAITRVLFSPNSVLLFGDRIVFGVIPVRAFSAEQMSSFREMISRFAPSAQIRTGR